MKWRADDCLGELVAGEPGLPPAYVALILGRVLEADDVSKHDETSDRFIEDGLFQKHREAGCVAIVLLDLTDLAADQLGGAAGEMLLHEGRRIELTKNMLDDLLARRGRRQVFVPR